MTIEVDLEHNEKYLVRKHKTFPLMFTFNEHHDNRDIIVKSLDGLKRMACKLVEERYNLGYFRQETNEPEEPTPVPDNAQEYMKRAYQRELALYKEIHSEYIKCMEQKVYLDLALSGNGTAAYILLEWLGGFSYRSLNSIETFE